MQFESQAPKFLEQGTCQQLYRMKRADNDSCQGKDGSNGRMPRGLEVHGDELRRLDQQC